MFFITSPEHFHFARAQIKKGTYLVFFSALTARASVTRFQIMNSSFRKFIFQLDLKLTKGPLVNEKFILPWSKHV